MANLASTIVKSVRWPLLAREGCFYLLIAILAWAPFPLGSNREWSWGLLSILVACAWALWAGWALSTPALQRENLKRAWLPLSLAAIALLWAVVQALPIVPASWRHPLWASAAAILAHPIPGTISLNPWRTLSEMTKLSTYLTAAWMSFTLARDELRARRLLAALIAIGAFYAAYAFAIALLGMTQFKIFYPLGNPLNLLSGPFVQRNNFATYEGLATLAAISALVESGHRKILVSKGVRRLVTTALKFLLGRGVFLVIAAVLSFSALIASASRAGFIATLSALLVMALVLASSPRRDRNWRFLIGTAVATLVLIVFLVWISGGLLNKRFLDLADVRNAYGVRRALWGASTRMIDSAPWLGLGLGSFQDAYPMYAREIFPLIMDKAHNDFLEFAAGLGLPAALAWWAALSWLLARALKGVWTRRKNRLYPLLGIGATILVAVHSLVDFSLQIPAVALTYAMLLGLGLAQSFSSKSAGAPRD